jgi:hypothetical protein
MSSSRAETLGARWLGRNDVRPTKPGLIEPRRRMQMFFRHTLLRRFCRRSPHSSLGKASIFMRAWALVHLVQNHVGRF